MEGQTSPKIVLVSFDWVTHVATFYRTDGVVASAQLPSPANYVPTRLRRTTWSSMLHGLLAETTEGDEIGMEPPRFDEADQLNNRVIVYIDQCIWRRIADAQHNPSAISNQAELAAAQELISLAAQYKVILPLSSGHYSETTRWGDDARRYQLGLTILRLSRGWQMRDPFIVRRHEIRTGLLRHSSATALTPSLPVFTLQPHAANAHMQPIKAPDDFCPEDSHVMRAMVYASAMIATILDTEPIAPTREKIRWVELNQRFSNWLSGQTDRSGPQKRKSVDASFLADISQEIAEEAHQAGLSAAQMSSWVEGPMFKDMEGMPSVAIYRSVLQDRHLNIGTSWSANDLTDMIYLAAATGYADVVVAERHMTSMLRQAQQRLGRTLSVYRSLAEALPLIKDRLGNV